MSIHDSTNTSKYDRDIATPPELPDKKWLVKTTQTFEGIVSADTREQAMQIAFHALNMNGDNTMELVKDSTTCREWKEDDQ